MPGALLLIGEQPGVAQRILGLVRTCSTSSYSWTASSGLLSWCTLGRYCKAFARLTWLLAQATGWVSGVYTFNAARSEFTATRPGSVTFAGHRHHQIGQRQLMVAEGEEFRMTVLAETLSWPR